MEKQGFEYVSYITGYDLYRKIVNGKGTWMAEDVKTGEFFPITYQQALGYEPIKPLSGVELLARQLGEVLLPH